MSVSFLAGLHSQVSCLGTMLGHALQDSKKVALQMSKVNLISQVCGITGKRTGCGPE